MAKIKISQAFDKELVTKKREIGLLARGERFSTIALKSIISNVGFPTFAGISKTELQEIMGASLKKVVGGEVVTDRQIANATDGFTKALGIYLMAELTENNPEISPKAAFDAKMLNPKLAIDNIDQTIKLLHSYDATPDDVLTTAVIDNWKAKEGKDLAVQVYLKAIETAGSIIMGEIKSGLSGAEEAKLLAEIGIDFYTNFASNLSKEMAEIKDANDTTQLLVAFAKAGGESILASVPHNIGNVLLTQFDIMKNILNSDLKPETISEKDPLLQKFNSETKTVSLIKSVFSVIFTGIGFVNFAPREINE